jgi:hypothetical protein
VAKIASFEANFNIGKSEKYIIYFNAYPPLGGLRAYRLNNLTKSENYNEITYFHFEYNYLFSDG